MTSISALSRQWIDPENLKIRYDFAKNMKYRNLQLHKDFYTYVMPMRDSFNELYNYTDTGKNIDINHYDDTAIDAAKRYANDMVSIVLPPGRDWAKFTVDDENIGELNLGDKNETQEILDVANKRAMFFINQSNLTRVAASSFLDLACGTAAIYIESSPRVPLNYRSIPGLCLFMEYSTDDVASTCWYTVKSSGRKVLQDYPKYNGEQRKALEQNPNDTVSINFGQIKIDEDNYFIYSVLDKDPMNFLYTELCPVQRIIVFRDHVRPGECEGHGIGLTMMPTIKELNMTAKNRSLSMDMKALPPMFYDTNMNINPYSISSWAGKMLPRIPNGRNPIEAMITPEMPDVLNYIMMYQDKIKKAFNVDPLGDITSPVRTAEEVSIRQNRAEKTASTDLARIINECPKPLFESSCYFLNELSLLTNNKKKLKQFNVRYFRFNFKSPLADIQDKEDISRFSQNLQLKEQLMGVGTALATLNIGKSSEWLTKKFNLETDLFKNEEEIEKSLVNMQQAAQNAALPNSPSQASEIKLPNDIGMAA